MGQVRQGRIVETARLSGIVIAGFFAVFPIIWLILAAVKSPLDLSRMPPPLFFRPTFNNIVQVFRTTEILQNMQNSVIVTFFSVLISVVIGTCAAYALSRYKIVGKGIIIFFVISVRFVPYIVFGIPLFLIMSRFGMMGSRFGLIMSYTLLHLPVVIWLMKGFFDDIPTALEEAAYVDGASDLQAFVRILLPAARPGLVTVTVLSIIFSWNEFLLALLLADRRTQPLTVPLTQFLGGLEWGVRWGMLATWAMIASLPVIIIALLMSKYLREGFTRGLQ